MFKIESEEKNLKKFRERKLTNLAQSFGLDKVILQDSIALIGESKLIPEVNSNYQFVDDITRSILLALNYNKKMLLFGVHGSGKSSHIEQVAARLSWPVIRLNLDNEIGRVELIGKDILINRNGVTEMVFEPGIISFAINYPIILILDEYDAATAEALFIVQQLLEKEGKLVIPETGQVIKPHPLFRIFATSNTIGIGDENGVYQGTNILNQGQLDRWQIIERLDYLDESLEKNFLKAEFNNVSDDFISSLIKFSGLVRTAFNEGKISLTLSTRGLINIVENYQIYNDLVKSLRVSFLIRFPVEEQEILSEFCQRVFGEGVF